MKRLVIAAAIVGLSACSPDRTAESNQSETATNVIAPSAPTVTPPAPSPAATPAPESASRVLRLEGLGALKIGEAVPANSGWAVRGAQESDACRTVTSPAFPGVYAIVEGGKVRRITVGGQSDLTLAEGIGVGSSEADVRKWFAGFRSEPHKYEAPPAKYLTAPNAKSGDPALRLEIGQDGKVRLIHIGTAPALFYVEGCS